MNGMSASVIPGPWSATRSRAPLHRVIQQVGDHALQHVGVADDVERIELNVEYQPVRPPSHAVERRVDDITEVQGFRHGGGFVPGELHKITNQFGELDKLGLDIRQDGDSILLPQHAALGIGGEQFDIGPQTGERGTKLVPGIGDQPRLAILR